MARIAVGGFQHETNSFAPTPTRLSDFIAADGWPGLSRGDALFDAVAGINLPAAGFVDAARAAGHELVPLLWCSAPPLSLVEADAYERIVDMLLADLAAAGPIDALYLDLHGAMIADHVADGEGELLRRIRARTGPDLPIVASLDLHANVTRAMVDLASLLVAYRTYPHVDMAETGARTAGLLDRLLARGRPLCKAFRKLDYLTPLPWQCTTIEPAASLYGLLAAMETAAPALASLSYAAGFPPADIAETGPSIITYGDGQAVVDAAADRLAAAVLEAEPRFAGTVWQPDAAVVEAMRLAQQGTRPVILADTQDNPGAGTDSDTIWLTEALLRQGADAVVGLICDPQAAIAAHRAGEGAEIEIPLGGKSSLPGERPLAARFRVRRLGDGVFTATGPFYRGARMQLGPMALLEINRVRILVSSRKQQAADQAMFRHLGIEPARETILALKSSVHFRADFAPIAGEILIVAAPGASPVDHTTLPYRRLRDGVRLMPLGPAFRRGPSTT
jgi:microcystin degradation protein MlrC